jgi:RNA polymerase sigma factor (sigma-70 family)
VRQAQDTTATVDMTADSEVAHGFSEAEFRRFYEATARPLRAWLRRVAGHEQVDDIAQEAYLRVLRTSARDLPVDERRAYLYRVASNLVNDAWRMRQRQGGPAVALDADTLQAETENPGEAIDMSRALARLRLKERTLLWLAYVERASHREIASALDLKEGSVRVLLSRARQKLAGALSGGRGGRG